ncbi:hypothetical protein PVL29_017882 [Vitis rotundifolia]|uniref:MHD domain-containing protein n=1 Tax=Vitis rotundifolia TaxID=103349 RepID=A0AA38Z3Q6_VITRO|nr:hypothetical protein PVL29_017882 [Vitis rotundifolia]
MLQCIFLLSDSGEVMLEKQLTGHRVDRSICDWFWEQTVSQADSTKLPPVIASPTHYIFQITREGITFLACTQVEMPPLMGIEFLCRVADVLSDYLGGLNEDVIKDNFVIVYELLDEMIDNGFPLTTEPNILREMIAPPNIVSKVLGVMTGNSSNVSNTLPGATASCVPWRSTEPKHANNEVYVDLLEEMDAVINRDGILVKCEIYGEVEVNSHLSGLPDLTLSFANPSILNDGQKVEEYPNICKAAANIRRWDMSTQCVGWHTKRSWKNNRLSNRPIPTTSLYSISKSVFKSWNSQHPCQ